MQLAGGKGRQAVQAGRQREARARSYQRGSAPSRGEAGEHT